MIGSNIPAEAGHGFHSCSIQIFIEILVQERSSRERRGAMYEVLT